MKRINSNNLLKLMLKNDSALRVPRAVTRLAVYRPFYITVTRRAEYRTYLSLLKEEQPCILDTSKGGRGREFFITKACSFNDSSKSDQSFDL